MLVTCPHCGFLVAAPSGGTLRCPRCSAQIDPRTAKPFEAPDEVAPAAAGADDTGADATAADEAAAVAATTDQASAPAPTLRTARGRHAPSFVARRAAMPARTRDTRLWIGIVVLALVLLLQVLLSQRGSLAADARWRPLVSGLCGVLQCEVPAWREPGAFTMLQRSVQPRRDM